MFYVLYSAMADSLPYIVCVFPAGWLAVSLGKLGWSVLHPDYRIIVTPDEKD